MAINIFPQLQFRTGGGGGVSGGGSRGAQVDPIQQAINLEQLQKLRKENQKMSQMDAAARTATVQELQPNDAQGDEMVPTGRTAFDPEVYQKELESKGLVTEAAAYKTTILGHQKTKLELESKELDNILQRKANPLKETLIEHDALARAWDYGKATNWADKKGLLSVINPYEDPKDRTVDFRVGKDGKVTFIQADGDQIPLDEDGIRMLGVNRETQLAQHNEMKKWAAQHAQEGKSKELQAAAPLREKYLSDPNTKDYLLRGNQYASLLSTYNTGKKAKDKQGISDIGMVFGYMKMLDPTSTVREGEYATARNAAGVPDVVRTMWNKMVDGDQINEQQRQEILKTAKGLYNSSKSIHDTTSKEVFNGYAREAKVNEKLVTADFSFQGTLDPLEKEAFAKDKGKGAIGSEANGLEYEGYVFPSKEALNKYKAAQGKK